MRSVLLSILILTGWASAASAQSKLRIRGPAASLLFSAPALSDTTKAIKRTHWEKGMWIGGGIGAVGLGGFTYLLCEGLSETDESCLRPALGGAVIGALGGGIIGALIGGAFSKPDSLPSADSSSTSP